MFAEVQFSTHLNDESDTPIFKKRAAFVFKYQAVTSERERKERVFSPIPKLPEINLTEAYSLVAHRGHSDTLAGINIVKRRQTAASENAYELLFKRIDEQLTILDKEIAEAKTDRNRLVEIATSFLPQQSMLAGNTGSRSPRAIGLLAAAAGAAGLILGDPVKDAACSALSIFSVCSDNTELEADVENLLKQQTLFQKTLERVQNGNDEKFFLLGNEMKETQESVAKVTAVVNDNLQKLDVELHEIKGVISHLVDFNAHLDAKFLSAVARVYKLSQFVVHACQIVSCRILCLQYSAFLYTLITSSWLCNATLPPSRSTSLLCKRDCK